MGARQWKELIELALELLPEILFRLISYYFIISKNDWIVRVDVDGGRPLKRTEYNTQVVYVFGESVAKATNKSGIA